MQIDVDPEQDFHVVIDGVAKALSLDALAEAYQADAIGDETLIWQEGMSDWMRLDDLLAVLSDQDQDQEPAPAAPEPAVDPNAYRVAISSEEVKSMTLQTLADAHRLGVVDDETLVQEPGSTQWVPLAVIIAGFATNARRSVAPSSAPMQQPALQQAQQSVQQPAPQAFPQQVPQAVAQPPVQQASAYPSQPAGAVGAPATYSAAPHSYAQRAPHVAPSAPNTLAPTAANVGPMSPNVGQRTHAPAALDDLDFPAFQNTKSVWLKRSAIAVGAMVVVFGVYQATRDSAGGVAAQPEAAAAQSESALPKPEVKAEPSAWEKEKAMLEEARRKDEAAAKAAKDPVADAFGASLAGEPQAKKAVSAPSRSKPQPKAKQGTSTANSGKSQYDPMNGAL